MLLLAAAKALESHTLLVFLFQIAVLLALSRLFGEGLRRFGQPAVVGELLAGVALGPTLLGALAPSVQHALFPPDQRQADLLSAISWLGVLLLLLVTGMEIDVELIGRKFKSAAGVSFGGILVPFASGFAMGWYMPDDMLGRPDLRLVFCLFMAVAMSISALAVAAKVLLDLDLLKRDLGQLILAAAMTDDTVGWILVSVVSGLAGGKVATGSTLALSLVSVLGFLAFGMTLGKRLVAWVLAAADNAGPGAGPQLSALLVLAMLAASLTQAMGIEAVLGAFVTGVVAGQARRLRREVISSLHLVTSNFVAPLFFAGAGLKADLTGLAQPRVLLIGLMVLAIAHVGKYVGCYLGGWATGLSFWERIAVGAGMSARGSMEVIVASIGLDLGVLSPPCYAMIVSIPIVTCLIDPTILRWALSKVKVGGEEAERLESQRQSSTSFVGSLDRVLLPARGGDNVWLASRLVAHLAEEVKLQTSALYVALPHARQTPEEAVKAIEERLAGQAKVKVVKARNVVDAIAAEAEKGYSLVVVGASQRHANPLIDRLLKASPVPLLVVQKPPEWEGEELSVRRILVPTEGSRTSSNAVELAALLGKSLNASVTLVHVVPVEQNLPPWHATRSRAREFGSRIVSREAENARRLGVEVATELREGPPSRILLEMAEEHDLIVMGSNLRPMVGKAFLGHVAERVLSHAPCAVAVVSSGP